ncbi:MAG TPA: hypothetical protein VFZ85_20120 [Jiangellaceae bacterium]
MTRNSEMFATLRTLDPADPNVDPHSPRARATLERILTIEPGQHADHRPVKARSRRGIRVAVAASATAVTAAAAVVILPSLTTGDRAFASWTATPSGLSAQAAADAAASCRDAQLDGPGENFVNELRAADAAIAERRGEWTLVALSGSDGFSALCITDESTSLFRDWIGSIGTPANYSPPDPRDVVATDLGAGSARAGELSVAAGYAGSDVAGVVYQSAGRGAVEATVSGGRFALWLPGDELEDASRDGVEVEVSYRDGSTATLRLDLQ